MFLWVSITKVVEAEHALLRDVERATNTSRVVRENAVQLIGRLEVMLCVCADGAAGLGEEFTPTNTGQNVLEGAPELVVVKHLVRAHRLYPELFGDGPEALLTWSFVVGQVTCAKRKQ